MKLEIWCDSGANIHSCRTVIVDSLKEFGLDDDDWNDLPEEEKEECVKEIALERFEWGFRELN